MQLLLGFSYQLSDLGPLLIQRQVYEGPQCPFSDDTHWQGITESNNGRCDLGIEFQQVHDLSDSGPAHLQFASQVGLG